jgi:hypothetical protein
LGEAGAVAAGSTQRRKERKGGIGKEAKGRQDFASFAFFAPLRWKKIRATTESPTGKNRREAAQNRAPFPTNPAQADVP